MKPWLLLSVPVAVMRKREDANLRSALSVTVRRPLKRRNSGDGKI
jgi:predicted DNA-binding ribbon-helix-helix protein